VNKQRLKKNKPPSNNPKTAQNPTTKEKTYQNNKSGRTKNHEQGMKQDVSVCGGPAESCFQQSSGQNRRYCSSRDRRGLACQAALEPAGQDQREIFFSISRREIENFLMAVQKLIGIAQRWRGLIQHAVFRLSTIAFSSVAASATRPAFVKALPPSW
jgi:hypothetical protein